MTRVVVVTGASGGIGRASAVAFGRRGDKVALLARGESGLEGAVREVEEAGGTALPIEVDVADSDQVDAAAERIEAELGPIDVWVNVAFSTVFAPFTQIAPSEFKRTTEVTYLGYVYGTRAALVRMKPRDHGTIVQVGSALAYRGIPLQSAYCAAKHALKGFNDSLQSELAHDRSRVRVTMMQLSAFNTPQFDWARSRMPRKARPMGAVFQPELAARAILWAARHGGREVTVGYPALQAIWGSKLLPRLVDWYLARYGYDGQQTAEPKDPQSPDNLRASLPGPFGAHGRFDRVAKKRSVQFLLRSLFRD